LIDILAVIPFDELVEPDADGYTSNNYQDITRVIRFGRMYKLIKMTRMLRILKIVKERSKFLAYLGEIL